MDFVAASPNPEPPASRSLAIALGATLIAGCATGPRPPTVPAPLQAPPGQVVFLEARASGVQIYECVPKINLPGGYEWAFRAPDATLTDDDGDEIGKHYAGPTWDAPDGSRVLGEVKVSAPSPDATAIPWLLLGAKATFGRGLFAGTATIQRVATKGGAAPTTPCAVDNVHQFARVPYTAVYYFYRPR